MINYVNLCVLNVNEGGEVYVEEKMESMFLYVFMSSFKVGGCECDDVCNCKFSLDECGWREVDLEEGLSELDGYYNDNGNGLIGDVDLDNEYDKVKDKFIRKVDGRKGRFYLWGVEYDYELMFVEEDSLEELMNIEFDDDGYGNVSIRS